MVDETLLIEATIEEIHTKALKQLEIAQRMHLFTLTNFSSGELCGATYMCLAIGIPCLMIDATRDRVKKEFEENL